MNPHQPISDSVRILNASFIRSNVTMARAIDLMESAFGSFSAHPAEVPQRIIMNTPDDSLSLFFKPAFVSSTGRMSIKILTQLHESADSHTPTIKGIVLLLDMNTGAIIAICDGRYITALRTGAASGIATRYLSAPNASSLAVFGCGAQGKTQLEAVRAVRSIRQVFLFDATPGKAAALAEEANLPAGMTCEINPPLSRLSEADIICTATPSQVPLFEARHLKPGAHINAIGSYRSDMQELDPSILAGARIFLDDREACLRESGDLVVPISRGMIGADDVAGEIGELINGKIAGRSSRDQITVFKSVGNAIQDFYIAHEAYDRAVGSDGGQLADLSA